jgi:exopolysaccharide biosynthesis protein
VIRFLVFLSAIGLLGGEEIASHPFKGVTWIRRTESQPRPVRMHVVLIDLAAPGIRFRLTGPSGGRETTRQTTLDFLKEQKAQIAISGHFFVPYPSPDREVFLVGLAASDGNVYSGFEAPEQSYAILADAPALNIGRDNRAEIVRRRETGVALWNAVSGSAQIVTDGKTTIPTYREGELTPGGPGKYGEGRSWYDVPNARAVAGLSRDRRWLILFTVDRAGGSGGMRVGEAAGLLIRDYGVWDALNLDGGGSVTLAMADPAPRMVNVSSDNPAGRAVGSNLAVWAAAADWPW